MTGSRTPVYLGIGSNIDSEAHIRKALTLLGDSVEHLKVSPIYKNPAQGFVGDDFLNLVVSFDTSAGIPELLQLTASIEQQCGRERDLETGKGSRTLDLDLLIFGNLQGEHQGVKLPRSDVFNYQFVWQPLLDLFAEKARLSPFEWRIKSEIESVAGCQKMSPMVAIQALYNFNRA